MKKLFIIIFILAFTSCENKPTETPNLQNVKSNESIKKPNFFSGLPCWSIAGSVGAVDEKSIGKLNLGRILPPPVVGQPGDAGQENIVYEDMSVHLNRSAIPGKYSIRYPIIPFQFPEGSGGDGVVFKATYKISNPTKDRITVYLKEWNKESNSATVIAKLECKSSVATPKYISTSTPIRVGSQWDKVWFVEAILECDGVGNPSGIPQLGEILGPSLGSVEICTALF
ncbi:MAG: hypothetical protein J5I59_00280 [Saprospiraceae bacterium]|nr:hypothetical protein [Saprospiraceae bacterium]WKZ62994.1 MAG: hypothetical protein QY315_14665 [Saprospiraceae bacterium]